MSAVNPSADTPPNLQGSYMAPNAQAPTPVIDCLSQLSVGDRPQLPDLLSVGPETKIGDVTKSILKKVQQEEPAFYQSTRSRLWSRSASKSAKDSRLSKDTESKSTRHTMIPTAPRSSPVRCTIPLSVIFMLQCLLIVSAFVIILTIIEVRMNDRIITMAETHLRSALSHATAAVTSPILTVEHLLEDSQSRYLSQELMKGSDPCSDNSVAFSASASILSEMAGLIRAYPTISLFFTLRWSTQHFDSTTGQPQPVQCAATTADLRTLSGGANRASRRAVTAADFADIDSVPYESRPIGSLSLGEAAAALGVPRFMWIPYVLYDPISNATVLSLIGFAPVKVNRSHTSNNSYETYTPKIRESPALAWATLKVLSTLGVSVSLSNFADTMRSLASEDLLAHASVYDLTLGTLLCTSMAAVPQYDSTNNMWPAGRSPSLTLNEAYQAIDADTLSATPRIRFLKATVVSASLATTPFGIRFAIVRITPRSFYFKDYDSLTKLLIAVGVCAAVLTVGTATLIAVAIQFGLKKVTNNMDLAARLRNHEVTHAGSPITELNRLFISFYITNARLASAKAYLPQHMLLQSDGSDSDDDDEDLGTNDEEVAAISGSLPLTAHSLSAASKSGDPIYSARGAGPTPISLAPAKAEVLHFDGITFNEADNTTLPAATVLTNDSVPTSKARLPKRRILKSDDCLITKRVTILSINARRFHSSLSVLDPNSVLGPTTELAEIVSAMCTRERGVIDSFHGDRFVLSFNAARHNAQGPQKAAVCAMSILEATAGFQEFSMGLSTGKACVGHLGTATLKRLSIVGAVYSRAMENERLCRLAFATDEQRQVRDQENTPDCRAAGDGGSLPIQCVADGLVAADIQHTCHLQLLAAQPPTKAEAAVASQQLLRLSSDNDNSGSGNLLSLKAGKLLYAVRGIAKKQGPSDEWLYEINHGTRTVLSQVNAAMMSYLGATWGRPVSDSQSRLQLNQTSDTSEAQKQLSTAISTVIRGTSFTMNTGAQNSIVGSMGSTPSVTDAVGGSAIQYARNIATARTLPRLPIGFASCELFE